MMILDDKYQLVRFFDILWVKAAGSYSYIYLRDGSHWLVALPIGKVELTLPSTHFVRIHRSTILSLFDIDAYTGTTLYIGDKWFPIGAAFRTQALQVLNILSANRSAPPVPI